jgi:hypothetical protein
MKKFWILLLLLLTVNLINPRPCESSGIPVKEGYIVLKGQEAPIEVGEGYYLSGKDGVALAQGIEELKAEKEKLMLERDAYKEAYEAQLDVTDRYAKLLKDAWETYDRRVKATDDLISLYEEKDQIRKKQILEIQKETNKHKTLNVILSIALIVVII